MSKKIDTGTIDETKAKVELIDVSPVSKIYAESLAKIDYAKDQSKDKTLAIYKKFTYPVILKTT